MSNEDSDIPLHCIFHTPDAHKNSDLVINFTPWANVTTTTTADAERYLQPLYHYFVILVFTTSEVTLTIQKYELVWVSIPVRNGPTSFISKAHDYQEVWLCWSLAEHKFQW